MEEVKGLRPSSPDLGDFQTPPELVRAVLAALQPALGSAMRVLEPSCGTGAFLAGLLDLPDGPREIKALELQQEHFAAARRLADVSDRGIDLRQADIFSVDLRRLEWAENGPLLVVGNPPWVTNSALGALGSTNVPVKRNLLGLRGIDAMTGSSNFDLTEYIWWKLLTELERERPTIALLSKTSAARRVLGLARRLEIPISDARIHRVDARRWFGAAVDACLFTVKVGDRCDRYEASVYDELDSTTPSATIGFVGDALVADVAGYTESAFVEGDSRLTWRQGLKHDLASVMELRCGDGRYWNGLGEEVDVEPASIYPLLKSSDLYRGSDTGRRSVIVTQRDLADDPRHLSETAPRTWRYLSRHADLFHRRRSSIYQGRPPFAMFGVGPYSFAAFKVAISGLYKEPRFRLVAPVQGRPVMLDDTCYFVAAEDPASAALLCALLNHSETRRFIDATAFWDSKRPITKRLLQRIDPLNVLEHVGVDAVARAATEELQRLPEPPAHPTWTEVAFAMAAQKLEPQLSLAVS